MRREDVKYVDLALTTRCNMRCEFCWRVLYGPIEKIDLDFNVLKRTFTPDFIRQLDRIVLCGTFGDPLLYPHIIDFIYLLKQDARKDLKLGINTNGTMFTMEDWYAFARLLNFCDSHVNFALDGIDQETHSIYRKGGEFDKAYFHMLSFVHAGGNAVWKYVVFKHNEHQIPSAQALADIAGIKLHVVPSYQYNEDDFQEPVGYRKIIEKVENRSCPSVDNNMISIDVNGDVSPCCHSRPFKCLKANLFIKEKNLAVAKAWAKSRDDINLNKSTLDDALNSEYFNIYHDNYKELVRCAACDFKRYEVEKI